MPSDAGQATAPVAIAPVNEGLALDVVVFVVVVVVWGRLDEVVVVVVVLGWLEVVVVVVVCG